MKVHFIEIGGSVIHQLDLALLSKGYQVTGRMMRFLSRPGRILKKPAFWSIMAIVYRDFAHAPSKLMASIREVR